MNMTTQAVLRDRASLGSMGSRVYSIVFSQDFMLESANL
jgi:hypothetical protein